MVVSPTTMKVMGGLGVIGASVVALILFLPTTKSRQQRALETLKKNCKKDGGTYYSAITDWDERSINFTCIEGSSRMSVWTNNILVSQIHI